MDMHLVGPPLNWFVRNRGVAPWLQIGSMSLRVQWPVPVVFPDLGVGAEHIWAVPIDVRKDLRGRYLNLLSANEHDRWGT